MLAGLEILCPSLANRQRMRRRLMEVYVKTITGQQCLLDHLIASAARRASAMLNDPNQAAGLRTPSDCGLTPIDRLEYSALAEDQLLAVALRTSAGPAQPETIEAALDCLFGEPPMRVAVEAQRHAAFGPFASAGLPIERAWETGAEISRRARQQEREPMRDLMNYADLYRDLWCDPRIAAPISVRREMLALVSVLSALARSDKPELPEASA